MKTFLKLGVGLTVIININESAYHSYIALKRSSVAIYYEGKILINYKLKGFDDESHEYCAIQLSKLFKINRGPSIKLAQNLAQYHHVLPYCFIKHMEPFTMENPTTSLKIIERTFKKTFKKEIFEVFDYFQDQPLASGSIAQVHKAKFADSNDYVAIKFQHPEVIDQSKGDFIVVYYSCKLAEYFFKDVKVMWIYNDFVKNMNQELDFVKEKENMIKVREMFINDKRIIVPKVYDDYCSKNILSMSYEEGKSICDKKYQKEQNISSNEISFLVNSLFNKQIFEFGFVHADPHHGNLFMRKEKINGKSRLRIVILDYGLFMSLDDKLISNYSLLWRGIFNQNYNLITKACENLDIKDPKIFTSMVTGKAFDEVMDTNEKHDYNKRLKFKKVSNEKVRKFLDDNFKTILLNLEYGRPEIPLLLKIVSYLKSNDHKLGVDLNTYEILMRYVYKRAFFDNEKSGMYDRIKLYFEYYINSFGIWYIKFMSNMRKRFASELKEKGNNGVDISDLYKSDQRI